MKYESGKLYKIRFKDHCIGKQGSVICEVVGWVVKQDTTDLVLTYWVVDTKDKQVKKDNLEPVTIVKSCIIRSRKLL